MTAPPKESTHNGFSKLFMFSLAFLILLAARVGASVVARVLLPTDSYPSQTQKSPAPVQSRGLNRGALEKGEGATRHTRQMDWRVSEPITDGEPLSMCRP